MKRRLTLVLVHGLAVRHRPETMLHGVVDRLMPLAPVAKPLVPGDGTLETLGAAWKRALDDLDGDVALLCHSMGGLVARQLLVDPVLSPRLRAVVTLGTPHAGSPLARVAVAFGRAYRDCTKAARENWAREHGEAEARAIAAHAIRCGAVVAKAASPVRTLWLRPTELILGRLADTGDGIVPAATQRWQEPLGEVDLDHAESVLLGSSDAAHERALATWERMARFALGTA